jgi:predicted DNA-binding transcriptional regulator AlpA
LKKQAQAKCSGRLTTAERRERAKQYEPMRSARTAADLEIVSRVIGEKLVDREVAMRMFQVRHKAFQRLIDEGKAPQPIRYNQRLLRWKLTDLQKAIAAMA